jgi:SAM-dependent methyltransferase
MAMTAQISPRLAASQRQFAQRACPVCGGLIQTPLLSVPAMPLIGCSLPFSRSAALATKMGDLDIVLCPACGHVYNRAFEPDAIVYSAEYENALSFSARHRAYLDRTVERLSEHYALRDKKIVEIGCGDGEFLRLLCEQNGNHGTGYDPSQPSQPPRALGTGTFEIVSGLFDEAVPGSIDFVCSKHVLEHLPNPVAMLRNARAKLVRGGGGYFEVPNGCFIFQEISVWDLTYEHFSYFSPASLRRALVEAGFSIRCLETTFGHQYLAAEVMAEAIAGSVEAGPGKEYGGVEFAPRAAQLIAAWKERLRRCRRESRKAVLWGAGTKAVTFLNILDLPSGRDVIDYVVDINPRKTGRFLPGTAQQIVEPDFLRFYRPDLIIVMNPEYLAEVETQLGRLQVRGEVMTAAHCPPHGPNSPETGL